MLEMIKVRDMAWPDVRLDSLTVTGKNRKN
jgi:hypothetical protein